MKTNQNECGIIISDFPDIDSEKDESPSVNRVPVTYKLKTIPKEFIDPPNEPVKTAILKTMTKLNKTAIIEKPKLEEGEDEKLYREIDEINYLIEQKKKKITKIELETAQKHAQKYISETICGDMSNVCSGNVNLDIATMRRISVARTQKLQDSKIRPIFVQNKPSQIIKLEKTQPIINKGRNYTKTSTVTAQEIDFCKFAQPFIGARSKTPKRVVIKTSVKNEESSPTKSSMKNSKSTNNLYGYFKETDMKIGKIIEKRNKRW